MPINKRLCRTLPWGRLEAAKAPRCILPSRPPAWPSATSGAPSALPWRETPPIVLAHLLAASHHAPATRNNAQQAPRHQPRLQSEPSAPHGSARALQAANAQTDSPIFSRERTGAKVDVTICRSLQKQIHGRNIHTTLHTHNVSATPAHANIHTTRPRPIPPRTRGTSHTPLGTGYDGSNTATRPPRPRAPPPQTRRYAHEATAAPRKAAGRARARCAACSRA